MNVYASHAPHRLLVHDYAPAASPLHLPTLPPLPTLLSAGLSAMSALLDLLGGCLPCLGAPSTLRVNQRAFKILRLLGEGGFSYVYLVQDTATDEIFALKKIRCPFGDESVRLALREVDAYRQFAHAPGVIHMVDHCVATERGGGGGGIGGDTGPARTVYIVLPYYRRGNLQDMINANLVNHTKFPEKQLLALFLGVCRALRAMHVYEADAPRPGEHMTGPGTSRKSKGKHVRAASEADEVPEGEQARPLMAGDGGAARVAGGQSYAHRDIKPANVMVADDGTTPVLMDFGSVAASPQRISTRSEAIAAQDLAGEQSTMSYRAPELFDVKTDSVLDGKVDIWSLGCTLYACLVGKSPFELRSDETGGSLQICVLSGDWRFPDEGPGGKTRAPAPKRQGTGLSASQAAAEPETAISEPVREVVRRCLRVEPAERPDIDELIVLVEDTLAQMV